ncbi:hypothetical protein ILUMI_22747 [Ignelater luminosus]|uniref:Uncharacterized protein n=1 Tax=Ignelater luminosus TaxID=2038154 RepID=A0A8K0G093_IGNLU|nr:hypothetical protein ILUMI_22747 [Ignelater luminosus]
MVKKQYHTPVSVMKHLRDAWGKLERQPFPAVDLTLRKEMTYFDNPSSHKQMQEYDHFFAYTKTFPLWDKRKNRDNRLYLPDIHEHIFEQEKRKAVPVLTSLNYGRPCRVQYDFPCKQYNRNAEIASLYRRHGVMPPIEREVQ